MRTYICLLYFIYSIKLYTAHALSCEICDIRNLEICHTNSTPCPEDSDVCINLAFNYLDSTNILLRDCGRLNQCDLQGTMGSVIYNETFASTCCNTSSCTPPLPKYPPVTKKTNGYMCPTSYWNNVGLLNAEEDMMECAEHQTQCFTYTQVTRKKNINIYNNYTGCASKDYCKTESLLSRVRNSNVSITCADASRFSQKCKFRHEKIKRRQPIDYCLPGEDVCLSEHIRVEDAGGIRVKEEYSQRCGMSGQCDLFIAISHPNKTIIINTICCETKDCGPPAPNVSLVAGVENGLTCRSCYSANSPECYSNDTMFCTGIMDRCVTYTATLSSERKQTEVLIGCGTKDACAYGRSFVGSKSRNMEVNITCTGTGNTRGNNNLVLILSASIMPIKLFYNAP